MKEIPEIGSFIDRTYKIVRQDLIGRFRKANLDITPEQWIILSKLEHRSEITQKDLGDASFKDRPTVSRIVDNLVKKGLLNRTSHSDDRRKVNITLTAEGRELITNAKPFVLESRSVGWKGLSNNEYEQLIKTLDKIFDNYNV